MSVQKFVCPTCKHNDQSPTAHVCRTCSRINQFEDHYEPIGGAPTNGDEIRASGNRRLAEWLSKTLNIACGNCPAEMYCLANHADGKTGCVGVIEEWLGKEAGK